MSDQHSVRGRVVRVDRDRALVTTASGDVFAQARDLPAVGDWVDAATDLGAWRIVAVLPRSSALIRRHPGRPLPQVLAANVDVVFVVVALDPDVNLRRLERTLAVAWESGATPVVVLTKPDRCPDPDAQVVEVAAVAPGVDVVVVHGITGKGVDALRSHLGGNRTGVLIGASGAGKSTIANHLLAQDVLATGEVRGVDRKGRHTTTARHLLAVPGGGFLVDTPGVRELGVWETGDGLAAVFADIDELAQGCRFRDCRHSAEPGCAVVGIVDADRLRNWHTLSTEVDPAELRRRAKVQQKAYRRDFGSRG